jgi:PAS domain S-box-containing protein
MDKNTASNTTVPVQNRLVMRTDEDRRVTESPPWRTGGEIALQDGTSIQTPIRLLYVDADGERQLAVQRLLEEDCPVVVFDVTTVSDADTALDWVDNRAVDCLVSAPQIQGSDGLTLLKQVRESLCDLPTVLVTDEGSEQLAAEAVRADVTEYVSHDGWVGDLDGLPERILDAIGREHECLRTCRLDGVEAAVEHAADAIVITDDEGTIEYANPAFEEITGYSREAVIGQNPRILKSGEQNGAYYAELWETILSGEVWEEEIVNETKSGERYVAHQTITPVTDGDGTVQKFVGIQRDVTRQKHLETQVERAATTLSRVYDATADTDLSLRAKIQSVLEIATRHLDFPIGYVTRIDGDTQHVIAAVGDHDEIQPDDSDPLDQTYCRRTIARQEPVVLGDAVEQGWEDDPAYERFGLRCYLGARVLVDGEPYGTVCFGGTEPKDELTLQSQQSTVRTLAKWIGYEMERHRYEHQLERQNERLDEFASLVSHDLRNPLNVAVARLDAAVSTGDEAHLEAVSEAHDRMETIIEDTLTLARQGDLVETTTPVSLSEFAPECWRGVETTGATLDVVDDVTVDGDPERLRHVFENLFRNAVEHGLDEPSVADARGDTIECVPDESVTTTADDDQLTVRVGSMDTGFYVADDGPGIDPDDREQVFDHGYTSAGGTGCGLSIVESIAEAHGWTVSVTGSWAGGARFEFETETDDTDSQAVVSALATHSPTAE